MAVDTEETESVERRGLSRRDMIRASAIAGAAAWTAPVIIDSLSSPAAATSVKYFAKLIGSASAVSSYGTAGRCYRQIPSCNSSTSSLTNGNQPQPIGGGGYTWVCGSSNVVPSATYLTVGAINANGDIPVTLGSGCQFTGTSYSVVGNYNWSSTGTCVTIGHTTNTATIPGKGLSSSTINLGWVYLEFTC